MALILIVSGQKALLASHCRVEVDTCERYSNSPLIRGWDHQWVADMSTLSSNIITSSIWHMEMALS